MFNDNVDEFNNVVTQYEQYLPELWDVSKEDNSYGPEHFKLNGYDINLIKVMLEELKDMLQHLMSAKEVHILSCPYDGSFSGPTLKAYEIKRNLKMGRKDVFVFDPNTEMNLFALSRFYDDELQSKRWLEIWAELALVVQEMRTLDGNESAFHFLCCKKPPPEDVETNEYEWETWERTGLKGNAQHGELRMAVLAGAKSRRSGLIFHQYDSDEKPRSEDSQRERERREDKDIQQFFISCGKNKEGLATYL